MELILKALAFVSVCVIPVTVSSILVYYLVLKKASILENFRGVKCQNDINAELDCYTMLFTLLKKSGVTERKDLRNSEVRM